MMTNTETTEWAVRTDDGKVIPTASRYMAERLAYMRTNEGGRVRPGAVVVVRRVTPWAPADDVRGEATRLAAEGKP